MLSQRTSKFVLGGTHIASTVTYMGRTILQSLVRRLPSKNLKVIYGKTDSIFVVSDTISDKDEVLNIAQNEVNEIVKELTGFENEYIVFDYEEFMKKMVLLNKNNYVKIYTDDSRKYKGASFSNSKSSDYELDVMEFLISSHSASVKPSR